MMLTIVIMLTIVCFLEAILMAILYKSIKDLQDQRDQDISDAVSEFGNIRDQIESLRSVNGDMLELCSADSNDITATITKLNKFLKAYYKENDKRRQQIDHLYMKMADTDQRVDPRFKTIQQMHRRPYHG